MSCEICGRFTWVSFMCEKCSIWLATYTHKLWLALKGGQGG